MKKRILEESEEEVEARKVFEILRKEGIIKEKDVPKLVHLQEDNKREAGVLLLKIFQNPESKGKSIKVAIVRAGLGSKNLATALKKDLYKDNLWKMIGNDLLFDYVLPMLVEVE